jgi:methylated-DNA-protein-cysteine methyltransferase-like protein
MSPYDPEQHGPRRLVGPGFHALVHAAVRAVPVGRVATYGDIALAAVGSRAVARQVGWALAALPPGSEVPWQRVVNAAGRVPRTGEPAGREQVRRLRAEGVPVDDDGRIRDFRGLRIDAAGGRPPR